MASGKCSTAVSPSNQACGAWAVLENPFYLANLSLKRWTNSNFPTHVSIGHILVTVLLSYFSNSRKKTRLREIYSLSSHISQKSKDSERKL